VAALDSGDRREFTELMAAADATLYRAKDAGRDQVQMISTTRGLSAASGASRPAVTAAAPVTPVTTATPASAVSDDHEDAPSDLRRVLTS
jgi:hypothetical protein